MFCDSFATRPCLLYNSFSSLTARIPRYMAVKVLVRKNKLQVAYKSAAYNLSLRIKARTEPACRNRRVHQYPCPAFTLSPLSYAVTPSVLYCTAAPHTLPKCHMACRHKDIFRQMATGCYQLKDDIMPKYRRERIAGPCYKLSRLTLR